MDVATPVDKRTVPAARPATRSQNPSRREPEAPAPEPDAPAPEPEAVVAEPAPRSRSPDGRGSRGRRRPGARPELDAGTDDPPPDEPENDEELETETDLEADENCRPRTTRSARRGGRRGRRRDRCDGIGSRGRRSRQGTAISERDGPYAVGHRVVRLRDRPSAIYVIVVAVVFAAILLNGIFLGKGGIFTPLPTEVPVPSASAEPSGSASASPSTSAGPSSSASAAPSASASSAPSVSAAPSAAPRGHLECPVGRRLERTLARRFRLAVALVGQPARAYPRPWAPTLEPIRRAPRPFGNARRWSRPSCAVEASPTRACWPR